MIGTTISHYRITEKLGAGGMGVVYRAEDTKLKRTVALKFLPPDLTRDPEAKQRFTHEAQAASALQHNNICAIHDIEETDEGRMFIVMDSYDGETLRSRIAKGRLRIEEATEIAVQIAAGLAEAHQHGIVHRDVKPANIVLTKSGVVKILDFGLAKLSSSTKLTKTGSTLGTVAYMAPEQLQGSDVDARADIFSLGVMLYEMLTGKAPFRGDHEAALMYSILNEEPEPLQMHIPDISSEVLHIVGRALEKDPAERYKTMDDVLVDLRRVRKETSKVSMTAVKSRRRSGLWRRLWWVISAAALVVTMVVGLILMRPRALPQLSPNSKLRALHMQFKDVSFSPILSPDGNWVSVGGMDDQRMWDVYYSNVTGGLVRRVTFDSSQKADVDDISRDGAWILYSRVRAGKQSISVVPSLGGPSRIIATDGFWGKFIPGTDRIAYMRGGFIDKPNVGNPFELWSVKLDGTDRRREFAEQGSAGKSGLITVAYSLSPDGKSLAWLNTYPDFAQDIITIDLATKKENRITFTRSPKGDLWWTRNDLIVYSDFSNGNYDLWMCPVEGGESVQLTRSRNDEIHPTPSDDGTKLLYYEQTITRNIHVVDLTTFEQSNITSDDQYRTNVNVSPDGRYIATNIVPSYPNWLTFRGIQIMDVLKNDPTRSICNSQMTFVHPWSPDGKWIAFESPPDSAGGLNKICIVSPSEETPSKVVHLVSGWPPPYHYLRWFNANTLSWFSEMKTWICSINDTHAVQFYEDSTRARSIQGGRYILYTDFRSGRQGWWVDLTPGRGMDDRLARRKRIAGPVGWGAIDPEGRWLLESPRPGVLNKISIPDGNSVKVPITLPPIATGFAVSQDGKKLFYLEGVINSKLMLWENPFLPN